MDIYEIPAGFINTLASIVSTNIWFLTELSHRDKIFIDYLLSIFKVPDGTK